MVLMELHSKLMLHTSTGSDRNVIRHSSLSFFDLNNYYSSDDECGVGTDAEVHLSMFDSSAVNPSDDLFRKFCCPLTPPLSPVRTFGEATFGGCESSVFGNDRLQTVSDDLDGTAAEESNDLRLIGPIAGCLNSKLISDCMWSGQRERKFSTAMEFDFSWKSEHNRQAVVTADGALYPTPCPTPPPPCVPESADLNDNNLTVAVCVNPTSVFPMASLNGSTCGTSGPSDSEEEIDVVTVDNRKPGRAVCRVLSGRCASLQEASTPPCEAGKTSCKRKIATYESAIPTKGGVKPTISGIPVLSGDTPRASHSCSGLRRTKSSPASVCRTKSSGKVSPKSVGTAVVGFSFRSTASCSVEVSFPEPSNVSSAESMMDDVSTTDFDLEEEPEVKRACHNTLERKRRVNLKLSFEKLREAVPAIGPAEKVPKVVILQKAAAHIASLQSDESELEREKRQLERRQEALLDKLRALSSPQV